ncbi:MAG: molybdenum cofactor biosynthesis protein MoaE [Chloroflexota bacterium]
MKVRVRFFALYRELVGLRETQADLPPGATALDAWRLFAERCPQLAPNLSHTRFAVNGQYVDPGSPLRDGDELVFIPPVSGGAGGSMFDVTDKPIDVNRVVEAVRHDEDGAVVTFVGVVRDENRGKRVLYLEYEAYPEMATGKMREIGEEIADRWGLHHVAIVHRVGRMGVGEASVVIAVAAPHRDVAFEACRYAIDHLKEAVPVWKKEAYTDGEVWLGIGN